MLFDKDKSHENVLTTANNFLNHRREFMGTLFIDQLWVCGQPDKKVLDFVEMTVKPSSSAEKKARDRGREREIYS